MYKTYYKNIVKISCICMKNIDSIIPSHNRSILMQSNFLWDVIVESNMLVGNCLTSNIIHCDDISNSLNNNKNFYSNSVEIIFTKRYGNHCRDKYECRNEPWQPSASCYAKFHALAIINYPMYILFYLRRYSNSDKT